MPSGLVVGVARGEGAMCVLCVCGWGGIYTSLHDILAMVLKGVIMEKQQGYSYLMLDICVLAPLQR